MPRNRLPGAGRGDGDVQRLRLRGGLGPWLRRHWLLVLVRRLCAGPRNGQHRGCPLEDVPALRPALIRDFSPPRFWGGAGGEVCFREAWRNAKILLSFPGVLPLF